MQKWPLYKLRDGLFASFPNPSSPFLPLSSPFLHSLDQKRILREDSSDLEEELHHLHLLSHIILDFGPWSLEGNPQASSLQLSQASKQRDFLSKGFHLGKCALLYGFHACILHIHCLEVMLFSLEIWLGCIGLDGNGRVWSVSMGLRM